MTPIYYIIFFLLGYYIGRDKAPSKNQIVDKVGEYVDNFKPTPQGKSKHIIIRPDAKRLNQIRNNKEKLMTEAWDETPGLAELKKLKYQEKTTITE